MCDQGSPMTSRSLEGVYSSRWNLQPWWKMPPGPSIPSLRKEARIHIPISTLSSSQSTSGDRDASCGSGSAPFPYPGHDAEVYGQDNPEGEHDDAAPDDQGGAPIDSIAVLEVCGRGDKAIGDMTPSGSSDGDREALRAIRKRLRMAVGHIAGDGRHVLSSDAVPGTCHQ